MDQGKRTGNKSQNTTNKAVKKKQIAEKRPFRESVDAILNRRLNLLSWIIPGLSLLFSVLLFDNKVSSSGDDSFYIIRGFEFIHHFTYPSYQGPLYPVVLGVIIGIAGLNVTLLKSLSILFMLGSILMTHFAFRNRIPPVLHLLVLLVVAVNSFILNFACQTYSEPFYMFLQSALVLLFFRLFLDQEGTPPLKKDLGRHALLALVMLALVLTRSIGITSFIAVAGYFVLRGQWKNLLLCTLSFAAVFLAFQGIRMLLWSGSGLQFSAQSSALLQKDFYNPTRGREDLAGFLNRLFLNSNLYISRHFFTLAGFRKYALIQTIRPELTLLFYLLYLGGIVLAYRKNRWIFFAGLLCLVFLMTSFLVLQTIWDQIRLIIPAVPFMLLLPLSFFYYLADFKKLKLFYWVIPVLGIFMTLKVFSYTIDRSREMAGNKGKYGGLTPDWKHYIQASEWAGENLSKTDLAACRKASISFIYGKGKEFYGIMSVPNADIEGFFRRWKSEGTPYLVYEKRILRQAHIDPAILNRIRSALYGEITVDSTTFLLYDFPDSTKSTVMDAFARAGVQGISEPDILNARVHAGSKPPVMIIPDTLLVPLITGGVTHVITANLRKHPDVRDGEIINTVERYISIIGYKYPGIMTRVMQFGDDNDEPAILFRLNYESLRERLTGGRDKAGK